ncbi:serine/threonine protein kinase [bacterium]|nr:serine/threonine protein kinase [bacterium]
MLSNFKLDVEYHIQRKIADGGMGSVYEALQCGVQGFTKTVAIKVLLPQYAQNKLYLDMFINEARLVASLVHENIVSLYHLGFHDNAYVIVMEYIDGYSLNEFLEHHRKIGKRIPEEIAVFIASRIARGLSYAHTRPNMVSVVHRDVSPRNILITSEGLPKLADFGLAMVVEGTGGKQTYRAGKMAYMSPEQAKGETLDRRTDIFSLGAVLFEMLTLHRIRKGTTKAGPSLKQAMEGEVNWDLLKVNDRLNTILKRCLALDPNNRYNKTPELAEDLERYIYEGGYGPTIAALKAYAEKIGINS